MLELRYGMVIWSGNCAVVKCAVQATSVPDSRLLAVAHNNVSVNDYHAIIVISEVHFTYRNV